MGAFSASCWLDVQLHPAVVQTPMDSWFCLYVCLSVRVESGIVADIEMDNLLPSDCDTFYQIKSQPINHRSVQSGHVWGRSVFQRLRVFSSHGCGFTPVRWSDWPSPSSGLFSQDRNDDAVLLRSGPTVQLEQLIMNGDRSPSETGICLCFSAQQEPPPRPRPPLWHPPPHPGKHTANTRK